MSQRSRAQGTVRVTVVTARLSVRAFHVGNERFGTCRTRVCVCVCVRGADDPSWPRSFGHGESANS